MNIDKFRTLVNLVEDNTPLTKKQAVSYLLETEDIIRCREMYKNNSNVDKDFYILATAYLINDYKK